MATPDPRWLYLFDPGELDHACELLEQPSAVGVLEVLRDDLRAYLNAHPDCYERTDGRAARDLIESADIAARRIALDADRKEVAAAVRVRWLEFIAAGAGYLKWTTRAARASGGAARAKKAREQAEAHWSTPYLEQAYRELTDDGRKKIGRRALAAKARQLASRSEDDRERRSEITERRARLYLERLPTTP